MKKLVGKIKDTLSILHVSKGFTLLELLVVVLIIGILAGIALPQYNKAVEKAKVTEGLLSIKAMEGSVQRYILSNGYPSEKIYFKDFSDIELSGGGEWIENGKIYLTDNFRHYASCSKTGCIVESITSKSGYALVSYTSDNGFDHECWTYFTDTGRYICKYLESQGWEYIDDEY